MYEEFFGLKVKPFRKTPDPAFMYRSRSHEEALARMEQVIEDRDLMLLIGEIGSGKTTLSRVLIDQLKGPKPVLIVNPVLTPNQFLRTLAMRLGADKPRHFKADLIDQVNDLIWEANEAGALPVVIIDEAQLIPSRATFEEIRLLTNFQLDTTNLLSLILLAQPEIEKRFNRKDYEAFRQRIGMYCYLGPLSADETPRYIKHRIAVAGGDPGIFKDDAMELIHIYTNGIPRKINNLAGSALLEGFGRGKRVITTAIIKDAARDLGMTDDTEMAA